MIDAPIGRHPIDRKKMAVVPNGKPSRTAWRVLEHLSGAAYLDVHLLTGRTHQIRVHMLSIGHPLLGDQIYAPKLKTQSVFRGSCCTHTASRLHIQQPGNGCAFARRCLPPLRKRFKNFDNNRPPSGGLFHIFPA